MPEASEEDADLEGPASDEVVESDWAPWVVFQKHHQEAESNVDHDMYVLEHCVLVVHFLLNLSFLVSVGLGVCSMPVLSEEAKEKYADGLT